MRRIPILLAVALVLLALSVEAQDGGYGVVLNWMKLPQGYILGTPQGSPSTAEREALARGGTETNASAFAGVAVDQNDNVYAFHRDMENLKERFPPDLRTREHPVAVFDSSGKFLRWAGEGIPGVCSGRTCSKSILRGNCGSSSATGTASSS